ncbi:TPX2 domain-containing protein [Psidium guajava]|nr:TPX2 domain-containing protein [Psidium guajava]
MCLKQPNRSGSCTPVQLSRIGPAQLSRIGQSAEQKGTRRDGNGRGSAPLFLSSGDSSQWRKGAKISSTPLPKGLLLGEIPRSRPVLALDRNRHVASVAHP